VCTKPERIPRWFLPIAGDLRLGGRFQLEGNAGGEITECRPPRRLAVTWEFGDDVSLVTVDLAPAEDGGTELCLRHAVGDSDHWATYGPGAVGVGWELALLGLALHLRTGGSADEARDFASSAEGQAYMRRNAAEWGAAHAASGAPAETADEAAARTSAAYAPDP
jgi:activator of Hsp90 ATPase-like protein